MCTKFWTALVLSVLVLGSAGPTAGQVNTNDVPAIQHTISTASDASQIADTSSQTVKAAAPTTSLQEQTGPTIQNAAPVVPQAAQINNALVQATSLVTRLVQAAPPASSLVQQVSATPNSISLAAPPGQQIMLNPEGVTFAASPDQSSMTIGNAGVRYNDPQENPIPAQKAGSRFPGEGDQVVQNAPLNDQGTGPAPVGGSHFQPLGTNVGGISTPSQKTDSLLASMGQPKPQSSQQSGQQSGNRFENNPFFRNYNDNSQRTTSYAANVPTTPGLLGGGTAANANPNAVTLTGPGGQSVSLGRRMLASL